MTTIDATVSELFATCPELSGFSVGQLDGELCLSDVETDPLLVKSEQLLGHIAAALLELIDEQPEAVELLRGRTFARTLH
jgi:hypothetical protein